jgi:hypothetical protein
MVPSALNRSAIARMPSPSLAPQSGSISGSSIDEQADPRDTGHVVEADREVTAMENTYTVQRTQHIDAPPEAVRERIVDLRRWEAWSPWEDLDPDQRRTYGGAAAGVGAWYEWEGNRKAGKGRMEIIGADASTVRIDLQFLKPFKSHSNTVFELQPEGDGTHVTWSMVGPHTTITKVMGRFISMDKMIGPDFEKGLARLGAETEAAGG